MKTIKTSPRVQTIQTVTPVTSIVERDSPAVIISRLRVALSETQAELAEEKRQLTEVARQLRSARATIEAYVMEVPALRALASAVDALDKLIYSNSTQESASFRGEDESALQNTVKAIAARDHALRNYRNSKNPERNARIRELSRGVSLAVSAGFLAEHLGTADKSVQLLHHEAERLAVDEPVFADEPSCS